MTTRFHSYSADEFLEEFVAPEDRAQVLETTARHTAAHFGRQLAALRRQAGLTQREVVTNPTTPHGYPACVATVTCWAGSAYLAGISNSARSSGRGLRAVR
jgi:hypothetical protein